MKIALIVIGILIIVGGAGFVIVNNREESPQNDTSNQPAQQETSNEPGPQSSEENPPVDPNGYAEAANIGGTIDATNQKEVTISIDDNIYETTYLKIKKGTKVTWVNNGNIQHDVTSNSSSPNGGLGSELLSNGESYEFTFDEAGLYEYFCTPHSSEMRGVITVVD